MLSSLMKPKNIFCGTTCFPSAFSPRCVRICRARSAFLGLCLVRLYVDLSCPMQALFNQFAFLMYNLRRRLAPFLGGPPASCFDGVVANLASEDDVVLGAILVVWPSLAALRAVSDFAVVNFFFFLLVMRENFLDSLSARCHCFCSRSHPPPPCDFELVVVFSNFF